jgi:phosphate:Na+ symporter
LFILAKDATLAIVEFLLNLSGAVFLLLFAVRQVRTGIERAHGAAFQRMITQQKNLVGASFSGLVLAAILQSSAAVGLLVAGFASSGYVGFPVALATILGADLGSALIIQILSFRLDWLVPMLLTVGGWFFIKTASRILRQYGRILLGIAFILISLQFLRQAVVPIRESDFLPAIAAYLASDFVTAYLIGAALSFVMHSSVATILMCVTLVQVGSIPFEAGLSLVLGANFGSALIPVSLSRGFDLGARRPIFANLLLRGVWSLVVLLVLNLLPALWVTIKAGAGAQALVSAHICFNISLLVLSLPMCRVLEPLFDRLFPDQKHAGMSEGEGGYQSCLDPDSLAHPQQAISNIKRELLHMLNLIDGMFSPSLRLFKEGQTEDIQAVRNMAKDVNSRFDDIRDYVSNVPRELYSKPEIKQTRDLLDFAIRLETAGDVVAKRICELANEAQLENSTFSKEGFEELLHIHQKIANNFHLASNILISDDLESARLLSLDKSEIKRLERKSRKRHLKRLQNGLVESIASSNAHLELLRALREFNSHICAVAYPILYKHGQLLETRLIHEMPAQAS